MNEKIILIGIILFSFVVGVQIVSWSSTVGEHGMMGIFKGALIAVFSMITGALIAYMFLGRQVFIASGDRDDKEIKMSRWKSTMDILDGDECIIYRVILDSGGSFIQMDIAPKTGFSNAKVTRILNKLEARGLVERRRSGMTNMVVLK